MKTADIGESVLNMLAEQHDLLAKVGELCLAQARVIEEDEPEQLVAVLEQRSMFLARATSLTRDIEETVAAVPPGDPRLQLIAQRRRAVSDLARTIAATDREHGVLLARKRDELARALGSLSSGRAAASAYGAAHSPVGPGFQDQSV